MKNRQDLIDEVKKYFQIYELVGRTTYKIHGERAWKFFDDDLLKCLLVVRKGLGRKMTINNWKWGGKFAQRGLRTIVQQLVKRYFVRRKLYVSAHLMGKAIDFDVEGMTAPDVRKWIIKNAKLFPCKVRLENLMKGKPINWTHLDTFWEPQNPKVYLFNV